VNEFLRTILFLPEQRSTLAQDIDWLHYFVILTTMAGSVAVAVITMYFLIRYRQGAVVAREVSTDERSSLHRAGMPLWVEGAIIVGLLGLFVMWWVLGFRQFVQIRTAPRDSIEVYVTAKKWMWIFSYPSGESSNATLYVPVGRPVKLIMTSRDVIHSLYVPAFRLKHDVVPGRMTTMWFEATTPGVYPILCTEYCGTEHSTMRGNVIALPQAEYRAHLQGLPLLEAPAQVPVAPGQAGDTLTLAEMGEHVANRHGCLRCHTVDGTPHVGPTWARAFGSTITLQDGRSALVDEAYLTESMMDPLARLHRGYEPVMPSYQGLLTAAETGALVEYIRSLRDVNPALGASPPPLLPPGDDTLRLQITPGRMPGLPSGVQPEPAPGAEGAAMPAPLLPVPFPAESPALSPPQENAP
jgi:cytochrome c oxidase subunit 2